MDESSTVQIWRGCAFLSDKRERGDEDRRIPVWSPEDQRLSHEFNTRPWQESSRDGTLGFVSKDEAYAMAMLAVVKAHQSRTEIGSKISSNGSECCVPIVGAPSSSPGSFVITMTPTCGRSFPQKPVESIGVIDDMD